MATLYSDLLMNPVTGDLDVSTGLQLIESNQVSLRQRLWLRFNVWSGYWYFDETFGFPYKAYLGKKVMKTILDNKIKEVARLEPDVLDVTSFKSVMDHTTRSYQAFFEVTTKEEEVVRLAFVGTDEYYYPTPDGGTTTLCDDDGWIEWGNKLYFLINFRLPRTGDATWWNTWTGTDMENPVPVGSLQDNQNNLITTENGETINRNH